MTISVLMAVYCKENPLHLDRALRSVWDDQTLKPNEILLIEDGPLTESLSQVVSQWEERLGEKMRVLRNVRNEGLTKSLNLGISHISTDLIARMDSDDISMPCRFKTQHDFLTEHPEISVVGGNSIEFRNEEEPLRTRHYPTSTKDVRKYICKGSPLAHPTVMIRREIFESGLSYNEKYRTSQDVALWFDVLRKGYCITNVPDITLMYRCDEGMFRRRSRKKAVNEFKIYMGGIWSLFGLGTWRYVYPIARFILRLMPQKLVKAAYRSPLRKKLLK